MTPQQVFEYFLPKDRDPDSCWIWQGTLASIGYGQVSIEGVHVYAHRLAYEVTHGVKLEKSDQIRHSCDFRPCVNPAHLSLGTFYDNMQDAIERNRFKHAEEHWNARLTEDDVRAIRQLVASGIYHKEAASRFGISRSAVTNIVNRKSWRQVA